MNLSTLLIRKKAATLGKFFGIFSAMYIILLAISMYTLPRVDLYFAKRTIISNFKEYNTIALGTCTLLHSVIPTELDKIEGVRAYNLSRNGISNVLAYYILKDNIRKGNIPSILIYSGTYNSFSAVETEKSILFDLSWETVLSYFKDLKVSYKARVEDFLLYSQYSLFRYRQFFEDAFAFILRSQKIRNDNHIYIKGAQLINETLSTSGVVLDAQRKGFINDSKIIPQEIIFLKKIFKLCKDNKVDCVVIEIPNYSELNRFLERNGKNTAVPIIEKLCKEYSINFLSYNNTDKFDLNKKDYFSSPNSLSPLGASIFSKQLAKDLAILFSREYNK